MRDINQIIVHCAATKPSMDIDSAKIREWHTQERGWSDIGYHWVIKRDGAIECGRPEERSGAHARGYNSESIGICLIGGLDEDGKPDANFTFGQYKSLEFLVEDIKDRHPDSEVIGHRDISEKDCPCFDVKAMFP